MHVPDGFINVQVSAATGLISFATLWQYIRNAKDLVADRLIALTGMMSALIFVLQMINFPVAAGTSGKLSEFPEYRKPDITNFDKLYFRVETQTTAPINEHTSLFFIKLDVLPLSEVWDKRILESINSMTENVLNYKGLTQIKELLNRMEA